MPTRRSRHPKSATTIACCAKDSFGKMSKHRLRSLTPANLTRWLFCKILCTHSPISTWTITPPPFVLECQKPLLKDMGGRNLVPLHTNGNAIWQQQPSAWHGHPATNVESDLGTMWNWRKMVANGFAPRGSPVPLPNSCSYIHFPCYTCHTVGTTPTHVNTSDVYIFNQRGGLFHQPFNLLLPPT